MNTSTDRELDDKIESMLRQLTDAAPSAPSFDDITATPMSPRSAQPNWIMLGAAASIVALGVGGLVVFGGRDATPADERPAADRPAVADSTIDPTGDPAAEADPSDDPRPDTDPADAPVDVLNGVVGAPLIGSALSADAVPLFEIDRPNWIKQYVYGSDELPRGDLTTAMVAFVGDAGPMFDQPSINITVFDAAGFDIDEFGDPIEVGGVSAVVNASETDTETGLPGPIVNLTVPLDNGLALRVNTVRLSVDDAVSIADQVVVVDGTPTLPTPTGFRELPFTDPGHWRSFGYQWVFDDGTPISEPVVVSTPGGSDTIDRQPSIEVVGQNLGVVSLMGRTTLSALENRVINGVDVANRPQPGQPGLYWADWLDGDWSFYVIGQNLESEAQFFDLLASLTITDPETFSTSVIGVDVLLPGRHDDIAADILGGLDLDADQFDQAAIVTMPTTTYGYRFELYRGLACTTVSAWLDADAAGDVAGTAAALAPVEAATARQDDESGLPSKIGLDSLAEAMRSGARTRVAEFGSNDCPLWSS